MNEMNNELYEKLSRLQWLRHKQHLRAHVEGSLMADPTRGQGRILAMLKMQDGISTKDLSYMLGIRISSLNELLLKMEKSGYIAREPSEADKRVMLVKLTPKGKNEQQQELNPGDIFTCLSEEEQKAFADYLDRIMVVIETEIGVEVDGDERDWWTRGGRERMGDEMFEHLAHMRRSGFNPHQTSGHHGFGGFSQDENIGKPGVPTSPHKGPHEPADE
ncbi:MarR family winged helix-turn-helix transcriptional regulator [Clostridium sp. CF012]|uniref:MarR family winged helix-turn-helix transcriptional regulator n=1 Tax=Clostridium sp. CF012 TaxID=2843319 RepID=UPI001C0DB6E4|nr:MarR family transcriptional regulator [Clostridium sp. CF012]MBU3144866.1 MarR family transcriptional regulator [Clostridium sp. CF012]